MEKQQEWKWVDGYEGEYAISSIGTVKSFKRNPAYLMKLRLTVNGYVKICLRRPPREKKYYTIHRLVARAFIPNPENKPQVNHKNFNKTDNRIENLEWCTASENHCHIRDNNGPNSILGKLNPQAKLSEKNVLEIRKLAKENPGSAYKIAKQFNVSAVNIYDIINYRTWKHLKQEVLFV